MRPGGVPLLAGQESSGCVLSGAQDAPLRCCSEFGSRAFTKHQQKLTTVRFGSVRVRSVERCRTRQMCQTETLLEEPEDIVSSLCGPAARRRLCSRSQKRYLL